MKGGLMGLDLTLGKQQTSPSKKGSASFWLVLLLVFVLFFVSEGISSRLRSMFPPCPEYGGVTVHFQRGVQVSQAHELADIGGSGPRLSGASYSLGGEPPILTIEPQPPTTNDQFDVYMSRFDDSSLVRSIDRGCAPVFAETGTVQKRPRSMVELIIAFDRVVAAVLGAVGWFIWRRRRSRPGQG